MAKGLANKAFAKSGRAAALLRLFCCVMLWAAPGCGAFTPPSLTQRFNEPAGEPARSPAAESGEQPVATNLAEDAASASPERTFEIENVGWRLPTAASFSNSSYRWRHDGLEEFLANNDAPQAVLSKLARSRSPLTAATAQIALARLAPAENIERLPEIVENDQLPHGVRSAALETYASLKTAAVAAQLQQWQSQLASSLRAEWLRAMARQMPPDQHTAFADALTAADNEVVTAALAAYVLWELPPPEHVAQLLNGPQPLVRLAALQSLRQGASAETHAVVDRLSLSPDFTVRREAIAALGRIGDAQARGRLKQFLQHRGENVRSMALAALAEMSDWEACALLQDDTSWRVRRTLAQTLEHWPPGAQRGQVVRSLLDDSSPEVRLALVASLRTWRPQESAPGLFSLLENDASLRVQHAALAAVSEQLSSDGESDGEKERAAASSPDALRKKWARRFGVIATLPAAESPRSITPPAPSFDAASLDELEQLLREYASGGLLSEQTAARRALVSLGETLAPRLEALGATRQPTLPVEFYQEVLAEASPLFAAIEQLGDKKVSVRRTAALRITELARSGGWPSLANQRTAELLTQEQDVSVWLKLLPLLAGGADRASVTAGYAAMSHPAPQVRRAAAEFLAASPDEKREQALASLLRDKNPDVVTAAARALAQNGEVGDAKQLRQLLRSRHTGTRLAAAVALSGARFAAGNAALHRIAHDTQRSAQRDAVVAMGEIGDADFLPTLIQLLDATPPIRRAALASLRKIVGDSAPRPEKDFPTDADHADAWRSWFEQQEALVQKKAGKKTGEVPNKDSAEANY